jgi:hypothetical protein
LTVYQTDLPASISRNGLTGSGDIHGQQRFVGRSSLEGDVE